VLNRFPFQNSPTVLVDNKLIHLLGLKIISTSDECIHLKANLSILDLCLLYRRNTNPFKCTTIQHGPYITQANIALLCI